MLKKKIHSGKHMKAGAALNIKGFTCVCSERGGRSDAPHHKPGFMNSSRSHLADATSCCLQVRRENCGASSEIFIAVA